MTERERLAALRTLLDLEAFRRGSDGLDLAELGERLDISRAERAPVPDGPRARQALEMDQAGRKKVHRLPAPHRSPAIGLPELVLLAIVRRIAAVYEGVLAASEVGRLSQASAPRIAKMLSTFPCTRARKAPL
jgi:hypothetical protein